MITHANTVGDAPHGELKDRFGMVVCVGGLLRNRDHLLATVRRVYCLHGELRIEIALFRPAGDTVTLTPADLQATCAAWRVHARFGKPLPKGW